MPPLIQPGESIEIRTAFGAWVEAVATSGVEGTHRHGKKIHDFPVIWVKVTTKGPTNAVAGR